MKTILLIDNYDSFSWNLVDYFEQLNLNCQVYRSKEIEMEEIMSLSFDAIVISPGPCKPNDYPLINQLFKHYIGKLPILGVCLGMQALGEYFGHQLSKADYPMHGKKDRCTFSYHPLFKDLGESMEIMRYHSLIIEEAPSPLTVLAMTAKEEIMIIHNGELMVTGFQFHPESIFTPKGLLLLKNWIDLN